MNTLIASITQQANRFFLFRLYKYYIIDSIIIVKKEGFKSLIKKRGWKLFAVVIGYYTVRDSLLYIVIPYLIARGILF